MPSNISRYTISVLLRLRIPLDENMYLDLLFSLSLIFIYLYTWTFHCTLHVVVVADGTIGETDAFEA